MKTVKTIGFQGDVMFEKIKAIPSTAIKQDRNGPAIIVHSETGHHHLVHDVGVTHFEDTKNPLICYLRLDDGFADVVHARSYDTHETVRLKGKARDIFKCRRQRERAPEGWRRVAD